MTVSLSVNPLDNGQYLIVLYSLEQNNFSDGTLLTIPVTAVNTPGSTLGSLNTVRTATTGAQSSTIPDATITATVEQPAYSLTVSPAPSSAPATASTSAAQQAWMR